MSYLKEVWVGEGDVRNVLELVEKANFKNLISEVERQPAHGWFNANPSDIRRLVTQAYSQGWELGGKVEAFAKEGRGFFYIDSLRELTQKVGFTPETYEDFVGFYLCKAYPGFAYPAGHPWMTADAGDLYGRWQLRFNSDWSDHFDHPVPGYALVLSEDELSSEQKALLGEKFGTSGWKSYPSKFNSDVSVWYWDLRGPYTPIKIKSLEDNPLVIQNSLSAYKWIAEFINNKHPIWVLDGEELKLLRR